MSDVGNGNSIQNCVLHVSNKMFIFSAQEMDPLYPPLVTASWWLRSLRFGLRATFAELQQNVAQQPRGATRGASALLLRTCSSVDL